MIFGRSPADTTRSQRAWARSTRPVSPVSTSTSRSGPTSTAQYGPGWTVYWASVSRYQRAAASSSAVAVGDRRQNMRRTARAHSGPDAAGSGARASGGAPQKTVMKAVRPSCQSTEPGTP